MNIIGHDGICDYLSRAATRRDFHHAYLFVGPESVGKRAVAQWWVSLLDAGDVIYISKENSEEKGLSGIISVETIRSMIAATRTTTLDGKLRIIIIDGVEAMNDGASNALLKTLEEPPKQTLFILITHDSAAVSGTVRSRCMTVRFMLVPPQTIAAALSDVQTTECVLYSAGRPGVAIQLSEESGHEVLHERLLNVRQIFSQPRAHQLLRLQEWSDEDTHALEYIVHLEAGASEKKDVSELYNAIKTSRKTRMAAQKQSAIEMYFTPAV